MCVRVQFTRGTVQSQHFYFDRNNFFLLQRIKNTLYYAIFTPSFESLVNAIPFAVFLWKCPPLAPIFGNIQDSVDKCVIVDFYIPTLNRKTLFDSCVLRFCDIHVFIISYFDLSVNMLYTNHIGTPVWNEDEWGDVDGHISKWSCCGTVEHPYERHTFLDGVCPTCGCVCSHPLTFPATCVAQGTCQICGLVTEEINPNNHDLDPSGTYVADEKEPTCTEEGYTGDTVCWNCRGVITKGTVIPANGHSDSWPATCKEPAWCSVCREHFGDVDPDNHAEPWSANYENITETTHDKHWYCCGMVKTEPHDPDENGVCRSCHYGCEHTGGEANCMEPAHCEKCGEPYGEKNPNRHKYTQKYACDNATHVERCKCGVIIGAPEPHTWENGWCTECYYNCRHIGGTATCTEEAICENCGERYGNAKGHTFGGWIKDATGHWHACADCGEKADEAAHPG